MRKFLIPSKDTTIYQSYPTYNAGLDEIIQIGKFLNIGEVTSSTSYATASARTLLYFDLPTTASVPATASYFLNLRLANASNVKRNQKITIYQVSRSWDEGSGYIYQSPTNAQDGATWRQYQANASWSMSGGDFLTSATSASVTLSTYPLEDLRIDVTNIIRPIVSNSLQSTFHGLALQFPTADEQDYLNLGSIKLFSSQTHTVHQPTLEIAWDNQVFSTGSLSTIPSVYAKITPNNLKESYTKGDVVRVNFTVRDEFPLKTFDSTLRYKNKYYLPTSSYYSITDVQSNTVIIDFDQYSKINTDSAGSYIVLDTAPLYEGRYYSLKLKVDLGDYSRVIPTNTLFKINL